MLGFGRNGLEMALMRTFSIGKRVRSRLSDLLAYPLTLGMWEYRGSDGLLVQGLIFRIALQITNLAHFAIGHRSDMQGIQQGLPVQNKLPSNIVR